MQRRSATVARHFASQFEEHLQQQKIDFDQFENFRRLLQSTGRQRRRMRVGRVGLRAGAAPRALRRPRARSTAAPPAAPISPGLE
jgi:hypothetical protein